MSGLLDDVFASPEQHDGDASWPDGLDMPHDERDVDVFAMVGALDLDAELPDMDAVPLTAAPQQELFLSTCPTDVPPYGATVPAQKPNSNYSSKTDRLRARNRLAQTKYRQKAKVWSSVMPLTIPKRRLLQLSDFRVSITSNICLCGCQRALWGSGTWVPRVILGCIW